MLLHRLLFPLMFPDVQPLGSRIHQSKNIRPHQAIVKYDIAAGQHARRLNSEQVGIAGTRSDKINFAASRVHEDGGNGAGTSHFVRVDNGWGGRSVCGGVPRHPVSVYSCRKASVGSTRAGNMWPKTRPEPIVLKRTPASTDRPASRRRASYPLALRGENLAIEYRVHRIVTVVSHAVDERVPILG